MHSTCCVLYHEGSERRTGRCRLQQLGTYVDEDVTRDDIPMSGENRQTCAKRRRRVPSSIFYLFICARFVSWFVSSRRPSTSISSLIVYTRKSRAVGIIGAQDRNYFLARSDASREY